MRCYRLSSGALSLTLFVALVSAIICLAMILLVYYYRVNVIGFDQKHRMILNADSGIAFALANIDDLGDDEKVYLDLFGERKDSVLISKQKWGTYDLFSVTALKGKRKLRKNFLATNVADEHAKAALYLVDERRPLSLAGKADIHGDVYIPKAGIRTAYVNGVGYSDKDLVKDGQKLYSEDHLPDLVGEKSVKELMTRTYWLDDLEKLTLGEVTHHSFDEPTTVLMYRRDTAFINYTTSGKIIYQSDRTIVADSLSVIKDCILVAPNIVFKDGFEGNVQAFATDTIIVEKNASLSYPSVLYMDDDKTYIWMQEKSTFEGNIIVTGDDDTYYQRILQIDDAATVRGNIYCNGFIETYGEIVGHLATRRFLVNTFTTRYENFMFNTSVIAHDQDSTLDDKVKIEPIWFETEEKIIAQWLH